MSILMFPLTLLLPEATRRELELGAESLEVGFFLRSMEVAAVLDELMEEELLPLLRAA